jgi:phospholipid transport system substrate-binding protein
MKANLLALFVIFTSATSLTATATPYPNQPGYPGNVSQFSEPAVVLETGISKLTAFLKSGSAQDRGRAMAFLETEVAPYFDFAYMTRWAAGPAWNRMKPEQQAMFQKHLTTSFMTTLAQKLTTYTDQPIRYFTPRGQNSNDISVSAWIMQTNAYPTKLEFRFYKSKNGWKIFDVKAAGSSAVVYYRNQFRRMSRNNSLSHQYTRNYIH